MDDPRVLASAVRVQELLNGHATRIYEALGGKSMLLRLCNDTKYT